MRCVPLFDQESAEACDRISGAVMQRRLMDLALADEASDKATVRLSLRPHLHLLEELPTNILVVLATLASNHLLVTAAGLHMLPGWTVSRAWCAACRQHSCTLMHAGIVLTHGFQTAEATGLIEHPGSRCQVTAPLHALTAPSAWCAALAHLLAACSVSCCCMCPSPGPRH